ncbi:hypothetical protein MMC21_005082 [Puttea exsequens]|nr:hypothetical protein [Puttea exsequens]
MPGDIHYGGWWLTSPLFQAAPCAPLAVVSHTLNHLDVFALGTDRKIWTTRWSPDFPHWMTWTVVPGSIIAHDDLEAVTAISRSPGRIDIFAIGTNSQVYTAAFTLVPATVTGWGPWRRVGKSGLGSAAPGANTLAVTSRAEDFMDLFVVSTSGLVYTAAFQPGETEFQGWWPVLPGAGPRALGNVNGSVTAISRSLNHLDIFVCDADGVVWTAAWEPDFVDGFHGWWTVAADLTFPKGTAVTAISASTDVMTLLVAKPADLWWNSWSPTSGGWGHWTSIMANGGVRQRVAAVSIEAGRIDVVGKVQVFDGSSFEFTDQWRVDAWRSNDTGVGSRVVIDWCDMGDVTVNPGFGLPESFVCTYY